MKRSAIAIFGFIIPALGCLWAGCEPDEMVETTPLTISLRPLFNGTSCGDVNRYDTSCLAAVRLVARYGEQDSLEKQSRCSAIELPPDTLEDFVFTESPDVVLGTLSDQTEVSFELYGVHDKWSEGPDDIITDPCASADLPKTWLFFGRSEILNLAEATASDVSRITVDLRVDCRDCQRGCETLREIDDNSGIMICPLNPTSYCVPTANGWGSGLCEGQPCSADNECFSGALTCGENRVCDTTTFQEGEFCAHCSENQSCDPGFECVRPSGSALGICAQRCPTDGWCPHATSCRRLGNNLYLMNTESSDAGVGSIVDAGSAPNSLDAGGPVLPGSYHHHIPLPPSVDGGSS
jgi:hypothetical protein